MVLFAICANLNLCKSEVVLQICTEIAMWQPVAGFFDYCMAMASLLMGTLPLRGLGVRVRLGCRGDWDAATLSYSKRVDERCCLSCM